MDDLEKLKPVIEDKVSNELFFNLRNQLIENYVTYDHFRPVENSISSLATNLELGKLRERID